jgi:hypothetical protein
MINLIEISSNKYRNRPATNSARAQSEKGMRLCAERQGQPLQTKLNFKIFQNLLNQFP